MDSGTTTGGSTAGTTTPAPAPLPPPPPPPPPPAPVQDVLPPANYALTWSDEFDGTALDTTKWGYMGPGTSVDPGDVSDTASLTVSNGLLTDQVFTDAGGIHHVGLLATEGKFQTLYGYVEARIKFHGALGSWCAFWIQSEKNGLVLDDTLASGTEIDVIEYRAYANEQQYIGDSGLLTLNWNGYVSGTRRTAGLFVASPTTPLQDNWHTYGVLWTPTKYTWYIDHYPMWESSLAPSGQPEFLLLTCQVWDKLWAGPVPAGGYGSQATSTVGMQVDYVRVWQEAPPLPPPSSDE